MGNVLTHVRIKLLRVFAAWVAALSVITGLSAAIAPAAHADTVAEENQFLDLTNQLRSSLGIQTLTPQAQLTTMARNWSAQMAGRSTNSCRIPGEQRCSTPSMRRNPMSS